MNQRYLPLAAALCLFSGLLGCWQEIKYEPAPEAVRQETAEKSTPETAEPAVPPVPEASQPAEPARMANTAPAKAYPVPILDLTTEPPAAAPPAASEPSTPPAEPPSEPAAEIAATPAPTVGDATFDELFPDQTPATESAPPADSATAEPPPAATPEATPAERLAVWQAAQKWSFAAAMVAKQLPAERYEATLGEAVAAALAAGIELPPLPTPPAGQTPEQAVVAALQGEPAAGVVASATARFGPAAGELANAAIRSNLLLLSYSPRRGDAASQAAGFTAAAEASGLPAESWKPLAELLNSGGEYVAVRSAIFAFHRQVDELLAK